LSFTSPEPFRVEVVRTGDDVVITSHGELDLATAPGLQEAVDGLDLGSVRRLVLDLRHLEFIDSTGIALMHRVHRLACTCRTVVFFIRGSQPVQRVFALTGLDRALSFVDDLDDLP
jgi:anti-anti-sigma factor